MPTDLTELTDAYPTETREKKREAHLSQQVKGEGGDEAKVKGEGEQRWGSLFEMIGEMLERVTIIEEHLDNIDTLAELRKSGRIRVAKHRAKAKDVTLQENVTLQKEEEKGKETFPPAPPIEKREKEKKAATTTTARVRACVSDGFPPTRETVGEFAASCGISAEFASYWYDQMSQQVPPWTKQEGLERVPILDWRRSLKVWWKCRGDFHDNIVAEKPKPAPAAPKVYTADDWILCFERCANYDPATCKCKCGVSVPPAHQDHQHPPQECPKFAAL